MKFSPVSRFIVLGDNGFHYVAGSRVPVVRIWGWYRRGVGADTLVKRYPSLGAASVFGALAFALDDEAAMQAQSALERAMVTAPERPAPSAGEGEKR